MDDAGLTALDWPATDATRRVRRQAVERVAQRGAMCGEEEMPAASTPSTREVQCAVDCDQAQLDLFPSRRS
jgi:hypothetical protein